MPMILKSLAPLALASAMIATTPLVAQSSAASYSYGSYNPVQAAINRNSMNDAIIKQATGKKVSRTTHRSTVKRHR